MGKVIWFTGLSGSGKTTISNELAKRLKVMGKSVKTLDGDDVRATINKHLGFSREDIRENNRLIAEMAKSASERTDIVLVPIISPYRSDRAMARKIVGNGFIEVFVNTPLEECIKRDTKGLYKKALKGQVVNFIGVSPNSPYEPPKSPSLEIDTMKLSLEKNVQLILEFLNLGFL